MYSFHESAQSKKFGRTSASKYQQFKWEMENYATHRYNVKNAKPSVDNSAPASFPHMYIRPKKLQLELERYSTIQRNNRFLLERLATIRREGAWIDNANYHEIKSLNTWQRQQEMISLTHNNQIMLARLQDVGPGLNTHKIEDEYLLNRKNKAHVPKYPPNWREIQEHMAQLKKETFKKVFDSKKKVKHPGLKVSENRFQGGNSVKPHVKMRLSSDSVEDGNETEFSNSTNQKSDNETEFSNLTNEKSDNEIVFSNSVKGKSNNESVKSVTSDKPDRDNVKLPLDSAEGGNETEFSNLTSEKSDDETDYSNLTNQKSDNETVKSATSGTQDNDNGSETGEEKNNISEQSNKEKTEETEDSKRK